MGHIFISYSHKDNAYAHKLRETLQNEGFEVWIDDRIDYGTEWPKVIQNHLDECNAFIIVVTENAYKSKWVQNELARAGRKGKPFFPLLLSGDHWLSIETNQYTDVKDGSMPTEKFYRQLAQLTPRNKIPKKSSSGKVIEKDTPMRREQIPVYSNDRNTPLDINYQLSPSRTSSSLKGKSIASVGIVLSIIFLTLASVIGIILQSTNSRKVLNQIEVTSLQKKKCFDILSGQDKASAESSGINEFRNCMVYNIRNNSDSAVEIMIKSGASPTNDHSSPCNFFGGGVYNTLSPHTNRTFLCTDELFEWVEPERCISVRIPGVRIIGPAEQSNCGSFAQ